jgi:hypothetical protein
MKAVKGDNNLYNFISDRLKIDIDVLKLIDFKFLVYLIYILFYIFLIFF